MAADGFDEGFGHFGSGGFKVKGLLHVEPEFRCCIKIGGETQCRIAYNTAGFVDDGGDAVGGHV